MFIMGLDPTRVYDQAAFLVGTRGLDHLGREFVFARFVEASATLAAADVCIIHADHTAERLTATTAAGGTGGGKQVGVAMEPAANGQYVWLARYGHGINVNTAIAAVYTRMVATATDGQVDDGATGETVNITGLVLQTAQASSAGIKPATLNYPIITTDLDTQSG